MRRTVILLLGIIIPLIGCEKVFLGDEPGNSPAQTFQQFWLDFDRYYAHFEIKNIDWDSVYYAHYSEFTHTTTHEELLLRLRQIVLFLRDAHVDLYTNSGVISYPYFEGSPLNIPVSLNNYIRFAPAGNNADLVIWGMVREHNFGYIWLKTFTGLGSSASPADQRYYFIDHILDEFASVDGIIMDVRSNGGGNLHNAEIVASRFADQKRLYFRQKYKRGPARDDFSDWIDHYIRPEGKQQFLKPVVVLTNKQVGSTAESFLLAMRSFPHVTTLGDTTAGASGNPIFRELPNGWTMRLSISYGASSQGVVFEGVGIPPDIPLWITEDDMHKGRDAILEKAIDFLSMP